MNRFIILVSLFSIFSLPQAQSINSHSFGRLHSANERSYYCLESIAKTCTGADITGDGNSARIPASDQSFKVHVWCSSNHAIGTVVIQGTGAAYCSVDPEGSFPNINYTCHNPVPRKRTIRLNLFSVIYK